MPPADIEELVRRIDGNADALALMQAVLKLHGEGLERLLEIAFDSGESGKALIRRFAADYLVSSLLLLHNLHPDDIETRVQQALAKMHGTAELIGVFEGTVRVRGDRPDAIKAALAAAVPDAAEIIVEESAASDGLVPLAAIAMPASPLTP